MENGSAKGREDTHLAASPSEQCSLSLCSMLLEEERKELDRGEESQDLGLNLAILEFHFGPLD